MKEVPSMEKTWVVIVNAGQMLIGIAAYLLAVL